MTVAESAGLSGNLRILRLLRVGKLVRVLCLSRASFRPRPGCGYDFFFGASCLKDQLATCKVVRVFRVVKFFRSLRTLVQSLMGTMKSLFWAMILLALIIYIFSILFTDAVIDYVRESGVVELNDTVLEQSFGTLYESYLTLFRSISNGVTWGEPASALSRIPEGRLVWHGVHGSCSDAPETPSVIPSA